MTRVLICEDDASVRLALERVLGGMGCDVAAAEDGVVAQTKLAQSRFDLIITDLCMPNADGFSVLRATRELEVPPPVIILTGHGTIDDCVRAMRAGAADFIGKPFDPPQLQRLVRGVLGDFESPFPGDHRISQAALVGESPQLLSLLKQVERVADAESPVLLMGERNTGKQTIARLLHASSHRAGEPFVVVDCEGMDSARVRDEVVRRATERSALDGGTLLFAGIGQIEAIDLAHLSQAFAAYVGPGTASHARVIVDVDSAPNHEASSAALAAALQEALGASLITVPALRDRAQDLPLLGSYFVDAANRRLGRRVNADALLAALDQYQWPGNLDELEARAMQYVSRAPEAAEENSAVANALFVPIDRIAATLILHDGTHREATLPRTPGQTIEALFDSAEPFIAVRESSGTRIYTRASVACLTVASSHELEEELPRKQRSVRVQLLSGKSVEGELRYVAVEGRGRVSDALNEVARTFAVYSDDVIHHIVKAHVSFVDEL